MKASYQWALHGLVIQDVLFHCASSAGKRLTNAAMGPAKLKLQITAT
jgi:hypothetical protein